MLIYSLNWINRAAHNPTNLEILWAPQRILVGIHLITHHSISKLAKLQAKFMQKIIFCVIRRNYKELLKIRNIAAVNAETIKK